MCCVCFEFLCDFYDEFIVEFDKVKIEVFDIGDFFCVVSCVFKASENSKGLYVFFGEFVFAVYKFIYEKYCCVLIEC